ncbi:MAG: ABC transporter ATP-binding protein [Alphaproteobacteria bacterium]|nr:ABC transporter ATP-binding protein [Alphaproteobacteria bacterium]
MTAPAAPDAKLLEVRDLRTYFVGEDGTSRAVDGVGFALPRGRTLCLVGESGCGKSVTALTIMGLVPQPPGKIASGEIVFDGRDLLKLDREAMNDLRGNRVAMIFQEPMTSLNPAFTIGDQIAEVILRHRKIGPREARERAIEMLRRVRIPAPEQRIDEYPHKLSGGMRQRAMIAMALALDPQLLIADEPTTALDVTIQAQILELLRELRAEFGMSLLLITHDLGVVAEVADEVAVMYAGRIVERADAATLFRRPGHPYTIGLLASIPKLTVEQDELPVVEGAVPNPLALPAGCRFHPRCPFADEECRRTDPALAAIAPGHEVACLKAPLERHVL